MRYKYLAELSMACLLLVCFYFLSRQAAQVSGELAAKEEKRVIVVDPGHGGEDPGMIGTGGIQEKGINLSIAREVKEVLEQKGFRVVLTRESDEGLYEESSHNKKAQDMQKRIALIDREKPLLTVSIHQNSYQDPGVKGPQVFYYKDSQEGGKLAEALQKALNALPGVERPRESKGNTSYYLLKRSQCTLVIVECGFLTNPDEAARLQTSEYQRKVAEAVGEGIMEYLGEE